MEQSGFFSPWGEVVPRERSCCCPVVLELLTPAPSRWDLCRQAMLEVDPVAPGSSFFQGMLSPPQLHGLWIISVMFSQS